MDFQDAEVFACYSWTKGVKCYYCMAALLRDSLLINSVALLCSWQFKGMILWSCVVRLHCPFCDWADVCYCFRVEVSQVPFSLSLHFVHMQFCLYVRNILCLKDIAWQMRSSLNLLICACLKHVWMCMESVSYWNPVYPEYTSAFEKTAFCLKTLCWQIFRVWNQICSWSSLCMPICFYCFYFFLFFYFSFG